eukprot:945692-Amphidinium_carterae.1
MLSVPKQQSHKRKLPAVFEGNKQNEQQSPTTTFKNWAADGQIYMSLEDLNLATMRRQDGEGLGMKDEENLREKELQRLLRVYNTREPILRRNADRVRRREAGIHGVDEDEPLPAYPEVPDTFHPFTTTKDRRVHGSVQPLQQSSTVHIY